jgi:hypothetical protein
LNTGPKRAHYAPQNPIGPHGSLLPPIDPNRHCQNKWIRFPNLALHQLKKLDVMSDKTGIVSTATDITSKYTDIISTIRDIASAQTI